MGPTNLPAKTCTYMYIPARSNYDMYDDLRLIAFVR